MPAKLGPRENSAIEQFLAARPKSCGDLHERMKWLLEKHEELRVYAATLKDPKLTQLVEQAVIAGVDLRTEVAPITPAKPPYGKRVGNNHTRDVQYS